MFRNKKSKHEIIYRIQKLAVSFQQPKINKKIVYIGFDRKSDREYLRKPVTLKHGA